MPHWGALSVLLAEGYDGTLYPKSELSTVSLVTLCCAVASRSHQGARGVRAVWRALLPRGASLTRLERYKLTLGSIGFG